MYDLVVDFFGFLGLSVADPITAVEFFVWFLKNLFAFSFGMFVIWQLFSLIRSLISERGLR